MRRIHLAALAFFALLTLGLSWPLLAQLTSHVPGTDTWAHDEYTFLWSMWYFKHALLDLHTSPLHTDLIFYPVSLALILYTYNFLGAVLALPLHVAVNTVFASNLINFGATILSGYGMFLLVRYALATRTSGQRSPWLTTGPALLSGVIYAFASNRAIYLALGHYNIYHVQWLPFVALYVLRMLARRRGRDAVLAGLFIGLSLLTDMLFGVLLAFIVLALLFGAWRNRQPAAAPFNRPQTHPLALLVAMAIAAAAVSAVLLVPTVREGMSGDFALEGWGDAEKLSGDLVGFVTPTALNPLADTYSSGAERWTTELRAVETGDSRFSDVNTVFLGYVTLALAALGALVYRRRVIGWIVLALTSSILALGPVLQINGEKLFDLDGMSVNVPLPFIITHYLPLINGYRAPNRFSIPLMLALAVLAGYGAAWLVQWLARLLGPQRTATARPLAALLIGTLTVAVTLEHLAWPLPLSNATVPAPYAAIAAQTDNTAPGTILQLPLGWRNGFHVFGSEDTRVQWYQSQHQLPIISGNAVRNPPFKFTYFQRLPLLQALTGLEMYQTPDAATDQAARASAAELMALWNVRYLVVNEPVAGRYPYVDTWTAARDYALTVLPVDPQPLWNADGVQVYAVQPAAVPFPFELDLGSRPTEAYRGPGWSSDEADIAGANGIWVDGHDAELFLPLPADSAQPVQVALRVQPFAYPDAPAQTVAVAFNGVTLGEQPLAAGWQELRFTAPAAATRAGLNRLTLHFSGAARPLDVLPGQGMIGNTGAQAPADIEINSGGAAQDIAYITITDADGKTTDGSAARRGYNLTTLDPRSGKVLAVRGFDTAANSFEAQRMAEFIEALPAGTIVAGATRGEAGLALDERAVAALGSVGSAVDLRAAVGDGHAFIGVKGAAAGSALEQSAADGAYLRLAADRHHLAAAVDWVRLEPAE